MINPLEHEIPEDANPSAEMHIDEESRPHFPPTQQTVTSTPQLDKGIGV
jgi:hypothetical protein